MKIDNNEMEIDYSDNEYIINLNEDCWECIFSKMDWQSWINFCNTFPRFEKINHEIQKTMLKLSSFKPPSNELINNFYRVKRASIMADLSNEFFNTSRKYLSLTKLEHLVVTYINKPIDFISSQNIKKLLVSPFLNATRQDYVEPILRISLNLHSFKYFLGVLGDNSIKYLKNNPIKELYLYDVAVTDKQLFTEFLSESSHLSSVTLYGWKNKNTQISFFSQQNSSKNRIKYLKFSIQNRILNHYQSLIHCTSVEKMTIQYKSLSDIDKIHKYLLTLNNLKEVQIMKNNEPEEEDDIFISFLFKYLQTEFHNRNIIFKKYSKPSRDTRIDNIQI